MPYTWVYGFLKPVYVAAPNWAAAVMHLIMNTR